MIATTGSRTVAHAIGLRLSRLPSSAVAVVQAIAVLGRQATDRQDLEPSRSGRSSGPDESRGRLGSHGRPGQLDSQSAHAPARAPRGLRRHSLGPAGRRARAPRACWPPKARQRTRSPPTFCGPNRHSRSSLRGYGMRGLKRTRRPAERGRLLTPGLDEGVRPGERRACAARAAQALVATWIGQAVSHYEEAIGLATDPGWRALLQA